MRVYLLVFSVSDVEEVDDEPEAKGLSGSSGDSLPLLMMPSVMETTNNQDAVRQTPKAKPAKSAGSGRRGQWKHRKNLMKLNRQSGEFEKIISNNLSDC